jgi:hypothetical protein
MSEPQPKLAKIKGKKFVFGSDLDHIESVYNTGIKILNYNASHFYNRFMSTKIKKYQSAQDEMRKYDVVDFEYLSFSKIEDMIILKYQI